MSAAVPLLETGILLPETFVVLQGIQGDGMRNTMESVPIVQEQQQHQDDDDDEDFHHVEQQGGSDEGVLVLAAGSDNADESLASSSGEQQQQQQQHSSMTSITQSPLLTTFDPMLMTTTNMPPMSLNPLTATTASAAAAGATATTATSSTLHRSTAIPNHDSFIVVDDQQQHQQPRRRRRRKRCPPQTAERGSSTATSLTTRPTTTSRAEEQAAMEEWNMDCRAREERQRKDWALQQQQSSPLLQQQQQQYAAASDGSVGREVNQQGQFSSSLDNDWWQTGGQLVVFKDIPTRQDIHVRMDQTTTTTTTTPAATATAIGVLSPGTTVVGTEMIYLDCDTLQRVCLPSRQTNNENEEHPLGVVGQVQVLKLESPLPFQNGYVVFSVNGYCYLAPGLPSQYMDPHVWLWRITYLAGAWVREGLELNSKHICTLPYGSFVKVTRKTVNDTGIPRLWVHAMLWHDEGATPVEGWISEYLNSASGERGPIAHPVPFPLPALYRVTLQDGALIRSDVELSSKQIGHAPCGALLSIVVRAFSEHPQDKCIERLKLAGNGGWVSLRLNKEPPNDVLVFKFEQADGRFDPDEPGIFHLEAQSGVIHQVNPEYEGADLSSIDESHASAESSSASVVRSGVATDGPLRHGYSRDHCIMCLSEERNATIVHGETGHIACCLLCARILKGQGQDCPVCRLPIDSVIQHFWA